jgi:hypothetical protein
MIKRYTVTSGGKRVYIRLLVQHGEVVYRTKATSSKRADHKVWNALHKLKQEK